MKGGVRPHGMSGFTIAETLIVLAVSGALLVAASTMINGRQRKTEFSQGVQQVQSAVQQAMDDVSNGYYPNNGSIKCVAGALGPKLTSASTPQGTNDECVFLGSVLQFAVGSSPDQYNTYTIAGLRGDSDNPADTLLKAEPLLIAPSTADGSVPDVHTTATLPYGLTATNMYYGNNPAANHIGAFAFISSLGSLDSADRTEQVDVAGIPGTQLNWSQTQVVDKSNLELRLLQSDPAFDPSGGIHICLKSGGTNQSALLSIGGQGRQLSVGVDVKENTTCS